MAITPLPAAPSRAVPSTFSTLANAFVAALPTFVTEANALEANVVSQEAAAECHAADALSYAGISAAASNFKGLWTNQSGAASVPYSVFHDGKYWMLLASLADVTTKEPGVDAEWQAINDFGSPGKIGETLPDAAQFTDVKITDAAGVELVRIHSDFETNTFVGREAGAANTPLGTTEGRQNTFIGRNAGASNTTGYAVTNVGYNAGLSATTGGTNTNIGYQSGYQNVTGTGNTNVGIDAGAANIASNNMFLGFHCGFGFSNQISGAQNVCIGNEISVNSGSTMHDNTMIGFRVGYNLSTGYNNTSVGSQSGGSLTTGYHNVLYGMEAGKAIVSGYANAYIGYRAGMASTGTANTGIGTYALGTLTSGANNVAVGHGAGQSMLTGGTNTCIGYNAGNNARQKTDAANSTAIGNGAYTTASNQVVIGNSTVTDTVLRGPRVVGTTGGYSRKAAEAVSAALSGASGSIAVNVPSGARILGVQLRVDTEITSGDGATSWAGDYLNTPTTAICSGKSFAKNTKYNALHAAYEITTGTVTIVITPNSGTFSAGVVRAIVYYETLVAMENAE